MSNWEQRFITLIDMGQSIEKTLKKNDTGVKSLLSLEKFAQWKAQSMEALLGVHGPNAHQLLEFTKYVTPHALIGYHALQGAIGILRATLADIQAGHLRPGQPEHPDALAILERICDRFRQVTGPLQDRRASKTPYEVRDEYDVQDLFHSLLWLFFDDVRPEECTPNYAGAGSRVDFLLKTERVIVEIKKTRSGLGSAQLGEELLIDRARYKEHPDCGALVCFVYDPDHRIQNPRGLEADLNSDVGIPVRVFIRPR